VNVAAVQPRHFSCAFRRRWKIHLAKKTKHARQNVNYLGRYLKRPPIAASRLYHFKMVRYDGFLANRKRGELMPGFIPHWGLK
jgi:hypothetical protein